MYVFIMYALVYSSYAHIESDSVCTSMCMFVYAGCTVYNSVYSVMSPWLPNKIVEYMYAISNTMPHIAYLPPPCKVDLTLGHVCTMHISVLLFVHMYYAH